MAQRLVLLVTLGIALTACPGAPAKAPPFVGTVSAVSRTDLPYSYRAGCPVGPGQLRLLRIGYWGFDGKRRIGSMVVRATVAQDVLTVFRRLYAARFPIRRMQPIDVYRGNDSASTRADNTSGFNCRNAVSSGPPRWSAHAFGEAIDVNPVENPYLFRGVARPPAGAKYVDRSNVRPGMAVSGGLLLRAFAAVGWSWGGLWRGSPDYQHFSTTGN